MNTFTKTRIIRHLESLEQEIQTLKLIIFVSGKSRPVKSIVEETAGVLSKAFPSGPSYTNRTRRQWGHRLRRLGIS